MTRLEAARPISTRQLALWRCLITLLVVETQSWVKRQDRICPLASITLTSANLLVTAWATKTVRSASATSRGAIPNSATSVVSSTTSSLLTAPPLFKLLWTLQTTILGMILARTRVVGHLMCLIVAYLNLACAPSPNTKPCSTTKLTSCKQRSRSNRQRSRSNRNKYTLSQPSSSSRP